MKKPMNPENAIPISDENKSSVPRKASDKHVSKAKARKPITMPSMKKRKKLPIVNFTGSVGRLMSFASSILI